MTQDKFAEHFAERAQQAAKTVYEREDDLAHPRLNQTPAMFDPNVDRLEPRDRTGGVGFEAALICLKDGQRVARQGWNGKGMFLFLVPGSTFTVNRKPLLGIYPAGTQIDYHAHIDMRTATGMIVPWVASQTDLLANDWQILED